MSTPETKTYIAAVIGCGKKPGGTRGKIDAGFRIGYSHAQTYRNCPRVKLACAADISQENLDAFAQEFEVPAQGRFTDYQTMLAQAKPDLVSVCTYVGLHRRMIEDCANAGVKGVLCEKPFVSSPVDLAAVKAICDRTGMKLSICHQRRMNPVFQRARDIYRSGTVGKPVMCVAGIGDWDLSEWGSHWLDMFRFFHNNDAVEWVMGQTRTRQTRAFGHAMEEFAVAYFKFKSGGFGLVDAGFNPAAPYTMKLVGTEGCIGVVHENLLHIDTPSGRFVYDEHAKRRWGDDSLAMLEDLLNWIEGGPVAVLGLPNTYGSSELNLAAYISAAKGDRVDLPLAGEDAAIAEWPVEIIARRYASK